MIPLLPLLHFGICSFYPYSPLRPILCRPFSPILPFFVTSRGSVDSFLSAKKYDSLSVDVDRDIPRPVSCPGFPSFSPLYSYSCSISYFPHPHLPPSAAILHRGLRFHPALPVWFIAICMAPLSGSYFSLCRFLSSCWFKVSFSLSCFLSWIKGTECFTV